MRFDADINLFDFTEQVLDRFRNESGLELSGYEFEFKVRRDWKYPNNRIHIDFLIFGEEFAHTRFDEQYDTVEKVVELLFVHLRDDAGIHDLREGLIMAKRISLETRTEELSQRLESLSDELLASQGLAPLIIQVDERHPYTSQDEHGFPIFQYQVFNAANSLQVFVDLDLNLRGFKPQEVYNRVEKAVKSWLKNR